MAFGKPLYGFVLYSRALGTGGIESEAYPVCFRMGRRGEFHYDEQKSRVHESSNS